MVNFDTFKHFDGVFALALLWGCPQLCKARKANHHPQKKPIPRQAGLFDSVFFVIYNLQFIVSRKLFPFFEQPLFITDRRCLLYFLFNTFYLFFGGTWVNFGVKQLASKANKV
jgi:hypothetical protein